MSERVCKIKICDKPSRSTGLCQTHYNQWWRMQPANRVCSLPECHTIHEARGFCKLHYMRWLRNGHPGTVLPPGAKPKVRA